MSSIDRLVLGTVALGLPYGVATSAAQRTLPNEADVQILIEHAAASGIATFDTAPSYGLAEERLGTHLPEGVGAVWTKLSNLTVDDSLAAAAKISIQHSLRNLNRPTITCLQWHNWQAHLAQSPHFLQVWAELRNDARIGSLGASTYGVIDALAAVRSGLFDQIQIEWNLLNQSVLNSVASEAHQRGITLALRSVFLQGVLTTKGERLPTSLTGLIAPRQKAERLALEHGLSLNALALRAALDHPARPMVLVGPDRLEQLSEILEHSALPQLSSNCLTAVADLDLGGDPQTDPRTWKI